MVTLTGSVQNSFLSWEPMPQSHAGGPEVGPGSEDARCAKVLVVDDSRLARLAAAGIIKQIKTLSVIEAGDGNEALKAIERTSPDVVLTDLEIPGLNGLELVAEIRSFHPEIPVVLMTAHGSEDVAVAALRAGATHYVPKSALARDLLNTLEKVLTISAMERSKRRVKGYLQAREERFQITNDPELIAPLVDLLLENLSVIETCDSASRMRVGVALHEALTNALFHGNLEVDSELRQDDERQFYDLAQKRRFIPPYCARRVQVHACVDHRGARFVITDDGPGFDTSCLNRPVTDDSLFRVGGRGMLLIRAFMDDVKHNESGNRITMIKRLSPLRPANEALTLRRDRLPSTSQG
jgi:DNA-binding NarL/FixJ family response regulator/anti-sigma regulatory factor (Ser/Thr protein kinase)